MDKIYHSYATRYANGERKLIDFQKYKKCLFAMSEPFWKHPDTKGRCVQTRNSTEKRILIVGPFKTIYV